MIKQRRIYDSKTSKTELPVTPDNSFQPFINVTKNYIKDVAWVLDVKNNKRDTPNIHSRGRRNQIKRKLDDDLNEEMHYD